MTKPAFNRDGILSPAERVASARKCLDLLLPEVESMGDIEAQFFVEPHKITTVACVTRARNSNASPG
jgi:hypothetical protein